MANKKVIPMSECIDIKKFNELGIKYTVESIVFLADHNRTMNDAIDFYGKADNIVYLIGAGLKEKTRENALNTLQTLMNTGLCLEVIYCLCVIRARENGFFINERGLETLESITTSQNLMDNEAVVKVMARVMTQYQKSLEVQEKMS